MRHVFDLDETLVSTREANLRAYKHIGVEPPEDFHVRPWQSWTTKELHDQKGEVLGEFVWDHVQLLPTFRILRATKGTILTNAAGRTLQHIVKVFPEIGLYNKIIERAPFEKILWLQQQVEPGVYWDDNADFCEQVRSATEWQAVHVQS